MRSVFMRHRWEPYLWILPSILLMLVFVVFPIGIVFRLAFSEISRAGVVGGFAGKSHPGDDLIGKRDDDQCNGYAE